MGWRYEVWGGVVLVKSDMSGSGQGCRFRLGWDAFKVRSVGSV